MNQYLLAVSEGRRASTKKACWHLTETNSRFESTGNMILAAINTVEWLLQQSTPQPLHSKTEGVQDFKFKTHDSVQTVAGGISTL